MKKIFLCSCWAISSFVVGVGYAEDSSHTTTSILDEATLLVERANAVKSNISPYLIACSEAQTFLGNFISEFKGLNDNYTKLMPATRTKLMQNLLDLLAVSDYIVKLTRVNNVLKPLVNKIQKEKDFVATFDKERSTFSLFEQEVKNKSLSIKIPSGYLPFIEKYEKLKVEPITTFIWNIRQSTHLMKNTANYDVSSHLSIIAQMIKALTLPGLVKELSLPGVELTANISLGKNEVFSEAQIEALEGAFNSLTSLGDLGSLEIPNSPLAKFKAFVDVFTSSINIKKQSDINLLNSFNAEKISYSGKFLEQSFDKFKLYDIVSGAARCFGGYVEVPKLSLLDLVTLKDIKVLVSDCSLTQLSSFNDALLINVFGDIPVKPGIFVKADVDLLPIKEALNKASKAVSKKDFLLNGLFPNSINMAGVIVHLPSAKFKGTKLDVNIDKSITIETVGKLTLSSMGIAVVQGGAVDTVKPVFPISGKIDLKVGNTPLTFDVGATIDPLAANAVIDGTCKGKYDLLFGASITDPGLAFAVGAAGVTGLGITGSMELAGKKFSATVFGNLSGTDFTVTGSFIGGLSLEDIVSMQATMASKLSGIQVPKEEILKFVPNFSLSECSIAIVPKTTLVFGKMLEEGVTIKGRATLFGKACTAFISMKKSGIFGTFSFDAFNFLNIISISGKDSNKPLELAFAIDLADSAKTTGLYGDANISLQIFKQSLAASGKINATPTYLKIEDLSLDLGNLGNCNVDLTGDLVKSDWSFVAELTDNSKRTSLKNTMQNFINDVGSCF